MSFLLSRIWRGYISTDVLKRYGICRDCDDPTHYSLPFYSNGDLAHIYFAPPASVVGVEVGVNVKLSSCFKDYAVIGVPAGSSLVEFWFRIEPRLNRFNDVFWRIIDPFTCKKVGRYPPGENTYISGDLTRWHKVSILLSEPIDACEVRVFLLSLDAYLVKSLYRARNYELNPLYVVGVPS